MLCVAVNNGVLVPVNPQPARYLDCALVVVSGDYVSSSPFIMTQAEGIQLGVSIASVWVVVGLIKYVGRRVS